MNTKNLHPMAGQLLPHLALFSEVTIAVENGCEHSQSWGARLALIVLYSKQPAHHQFNTLDLNKERNGEEKGREGWPESCSYNSGQAVRIRLVAPTLASVSGETSSSGTHSLVVFLPGICSTQHRCHQTTESHCESRVKVKYPWLIYSLCHSLAGPWQWN